MKSSRIFQRIILPVVIGIILIIAIFSKLGSNKAKMEADAAIGAKKRTVFPVTIAQPTNTELTQDFTLNGTFEPDHSLQFSSDISGRVKKLNIENGQKVRQGEVIATVDGDQLGIDLKMAKINLEKATSDLDKYETMLKSNAVSKQQVEEAKLSVKRAESTVETLKRQMTLTTLRAPISGVIYDLAIEQGSFLAPGTPIAQIIDIANLKIAVKLRDDQVVRIKDNQVVSIQPDLYKETRLSGKVAVIAPEADGSRKYETEIRFTNPGKTPLKSGMTGKVLFQFGGSKTALTIPSTSLIGSTKNPQVYVIEGGKARLTSIQIGEITDNKIEIISGLKPGMQVVTSGQLNLANGSPVTIIK